MRHFGLTMFIFISAFDWLVC